jgi:hypothetical protein
MCKQYNLLNFSVFIKLNSDQLRSSGPEEFCLLRVMIFNNKLPATVRPGKRKSPYGEG